MTAINSQMLGMLKGVTPRMVNGITSLYSHYEQLVAIGAQGIVDTVSGATMTAANAVVVFSRTQIPHDPYLDRLKTYLLLQDCEAIRGIASFLKMGAGDTLVGDTPEVLSQALIDWLVGDSLVEKAKRKYRHFVTPGEPDRGFTGAIALGGGTAVGERGVSVGGDVLPGTTIVTGDNNSDLDDLLDDLFD